MDVLKMIVFFISGLIFCSHNCMCASVVEVTVRPGENITIYCDCKRSLGVYNVWFFRNCSHENQPPYVIDVKDQIKQERQFPRLKYVKNDSSEAFDLLLMNASDTDVGFYYCGTAQLKVEGEKMLYVKDVYTYGNITTRLTLNTCGPPVFPAKTVEDCSVCWRLLFSLCPAVFLVSVLFSSVLFNLLSHKTGKKNQDDGRLLEQKRHTEETQDENVFYAALEIHQPTKRTQKKRGIQSSDFRTHTTVKYASKEDSHSFEM